jgi:RNA polymerase sigma-70 factor (ECF subfamily)
VGRCTAPECCIEAAERKLYRRKIQRAGQRIPIVSGGRKQMPAPVFEMGSRENGSSVYFLRAHVYANLHKLLDSFSPRDKGSAHVKVVYCDNCGFNIALSSPENAVQHQDGKVFCAKCHSANMAVAHVPNKDNLIPIKPAQPVAKWQEARMVTTAAQQILRNGAMEPSSEFPPEYWQLIEQYRERLLTQAQTILGNAAEAEDVVQETLFQAFRRRTKLSRAESIGAWLLNMNRCNALNRLRANRRAKATLARKQTDQPADLFNTGGFSGIETREMLAQMIETLQPNLRAVVALRFWEHLSYAEIAERLKLPQGTVGYLLADACRILNEKLKAARQR